jgi:hypothetical protein
MAPADLIRLALTRVGTRSGPTYPSPAPASSFIRNNHNARAYEVSLARVPTRATRDRSDLSNQPPNE